MNYGYEPELDLPLLQDWCDFCEGRRDFEMYHFSTILMGVFLGGVTPEVEDFLRRFCKYFPKQLNVNLLRIASNELLDRDVLRWVKRDLHEKRRILEISDGTSDAMKLIGNGNYLFTHDRNQLFEARNSENQHAMYSAVGDFVSEICGDNDHLSALVEALYNIATDYSVAHSIMAPILKTNIDLSNYFEVYLRGGDYALTENHILVYLFRPQSDSSS